MVLPSTSQGSGSVPLLRKGGKIMGCVLWYGEGGKSGLTHSPHKVPQTSKLHRERRDWLSAEGPT